MATRRKKIEVVAERTEICRECRHAHFGDDVIACRRFPPVPVWEGDEGVCSHFPVIAADHWCGEFAAKLSS